MSLTSKILGTRKKDMIFTILIIYVAFFVVLLTFTFTFNLQALKSKAIIYGGFGGAVLYFLYTEADRREKVQKQVLPPKTQETKT